MSLDAAFLQDILDGPDDDAPRLIYADWLDDQGQAERAEFIRVQCEIAKLSEGPRRRDLERREQALWSAHGWRWLAPFRPLCVDPFAASQVQFPRFRRGFLEVLSLTWKEAAPHLPELLSRAPLRELAFHEVPGAVEQLAREPRATWLTMLELPHARLGNEGTRTLCAARHLTRLTELNLSVNDLGNEGARYLAEASHMNRLTHLDLSDNVIDDAGVMALSSAPHLGRLHHLDLTRNSFGPAGAEALIRSASLSGLANLDLSWTGLDDDSARLLARSPRLERLTHLYLGHTDLTDAGVVALARSRHARNLKALHLTGLGLTNKSVEAIIRSPYLAGLEDLELTAYEIDEEAQKRLGDHFDGSVVSFDSD